MATAHSSRVAKVLTESHGESPPMIHSTHPPSADVGEARPSTASVERIRRRIGSPPDLNRIEGELSAANYRRGLHFRSDMGGMLLRFARALRRRCPNCAGPVMVGWFGIRPACPRCALRLDRGEEGYFVGAIVFNMAFAE